MAITRLMDKRKMRCFNTATVHAQQDALRCFFNKLDNALVCNEIAVTIQLYLLILSAKMANR